MKKAQELNVKGTPVRVLRVGEEDFICLTDMAAGRGDDVRAADVIKNWLRARYTLEFLGTWEQLHNPAFKVVEFDHFKAQAGLPSFTLSVSEWIESTNAVSISSDPFMPCPFGPRDIWVSGGMTPGCHGV